MKRHKRPRHPITVNVRVTEADITKVRFAANLLAQEGASWAGAPPMLRESFADLVATLLALQRIVLHAASRAVAGNPPTTLLGVADVVEHNVALCAFHDDLVALLKALGREEVTTKGWDA